MVRPQQCCVHSLSESLSLCACGQEARFVTEKMWPAAGMYGMVENAIKEYSFVRDYVFNQAKGQVMKMTLGNYPAPLKIVDVLRFSTRFERIRLD